MHRGLVAHAAMVLYSRATSEAVVNGLVLVLNANFEPLHVCETRRALNLIVGGKARLVARARLRAHVRLSYPRPSVIQLQKMIRRPHPRVRLSKREVFRRDEFTCQYCGRQTPHLTIDHVIPRHKGGSHSWANLVAACPPCNRRKGGRTTDEAHMRLQRIPREPPATACYLYGRHLDDNHEWGDYLEGW
jgi:5-methylcytosine-specific restriction endonuclease McrA